MLECSNDRLSNEQARVLTIADRLVGSGEPCLIIGEVAQAHDGSLGLAHAFIDAIADAGACAVKFQTHIAAAESTSADAFRVKFSWQDDTRYDYWRRMEFTPKQWRGLADHARERGLIFLSSPFSIEAVELLIDVGVPAWKIASGEVTNLPMLERILDTKLPVLLSSGMSSFKRTDWVIGLIQSKDVPFLVFQCTSSYPVPLEELGLNLLHVYRERYGCPVGLSDHSGRIYAGLAAATLGADAIEVHVTLSREMFGPDVKTSVTTKELQQLVDGIRYIEKALANPVEKDTKAQDLASLWKLFSKSVVAKTDLTAGTLLFAEHLTTKKPGTGFPAERIHELFGRRLKRDVLGDEQISEMDLE